MVDASNGANVCLQNDTVINMNCMLENQNPIKIQNRSQRRFIRIPESIILDASLGDKRVTVFSFMSFFSGINDKLWFSIGDMVEWSGRKPRRNSGGINDRFRESVSALVDDGYAEIVSGGYDSGYACASFCSDRIKDECDANGFAMIYEDEMDRIFDCDFIDKGKDEALLVFAYLRRFIFRRCNRFRLEEQHLTVDERKAKSPDVLYDYYSNIACKLGITSRMASNMVEALANLGLVYYENMPRANIEGRWVTQPTLFCNTYKRENGYVIASGRDYYMAEIKNEKKNMRR